MLMLKSLLEELTKRRSETFCKLEDANSVRNTIGAILSSVSMWNIVKQLRKHDIFLLLDFPSGNVVNNLKGKKIFPNHMNRNSL